MSVSLIARDLVLCLWSPYVYDVPYTLFHLNTSLGNHSLCLGLSLSITLYSVASDVGIQLYRARLQQTYVIPGNYDYSNSAKVSERASR